MFSFLNRKSKEQNVLMEAHSRSPYKDMPFEQFLQEAESLAKGKIGLIDFDEAFYISVNKDVASAVAAGKFLCGYIHFCLFGQFENRPWSTQHIMRTFGKNPHTPQGLMEPVNSRPLPSYGPNLSELPHETTPFLLIFVPHLHDNLFFAGYSGFFRDLSAIYQDFSRIVVVVTFPGFNPELVTQLCNRIEVVAFDDIQHFTTQPDLIFCFDCETFYIARDVFHNLDRTIYYCQDFEAGFHSFGSVFARAEGAVALSRNIVLSTSLLKIFLEQRGLLSADRVFVTTPAIEILDVAREKTKRLFFYFRPERFNTRNMPELIMGAVEAFCQKHRGYEIFLVGSVETSYSRNINGTNVTVINKLPKDQYIKLLTSCDVVCALIYSAHPGVIAFQSAASGIPTVTNIFDNRNAAYLKAISNNLVAFDPVRESLLERVEEALSLPKGEKSFNRTLYGGTESRTFGEFVEYVMLQNQ